MKITWNTMLLICLIAFMILMVSIPFLRDAKKEVICTEKGNITWTYFLNDFLDDCARKCDTSGAFEKVKYDKECLKWCFDLALGLSK